MLKKAVIYHETTLRGLELSDYYDDIPFIRNPNYKFTFSLFDFRKETYQKKRTKRTLSDALQYFGSYKVACILYDTQSKEANIVLKNKEKGRRK